MAVKVSYFYKQRSLLGGLSHQIFIQFFLFVANYCVILPSIEFTRFLPFETRLVLSMDGREVAGVAAACNPKFKLDSHRLEEY